MSDIKGYLRTSDEKGSVNISQSVVATIAAAAAVDVDGVYGLYHSSGKEVTDVGARRGTPKGVKVTLEENNILVDVMIMAELGSNVAEVATAVQSAVKTAIEEATGSKVGEVNINIGGVSLKRRSKQNAPPRPAEPKNTAGV